MARSANDRKAEAARYHQMTEEAIEMGERKPVFPTNRSNEIIQRRNSGIRPQYINSIGGDSSNYR